MKKIWKALLAVGMLAAAFFLSNQLCFLFSKALDHVNPGFLFEYATEGNFDRNIYFSEEVQADTGILQDIDPWLAPGDAHSLIQLSKKITKYQVELLPVFYGNSAYMDYLRRMDTSVSELFQFCKNFDELAENLAFACRYLLFLSWVIGVHFLMKCRPFLYFGMGLTCIFASVMRISNRLFAGLFANGKDAFHLYADDLIPALIEAMLTFLIFDVTFTTLEKGRLEQRLEPLYQELSSIGFLVAFLARHIESETVYRPGLSALLPEFLEYARRPPRGKKGARLASAVKALDKPHTNRTLLDSLVFIQSLMPPR